MQWNNHSEYTDRHAFLSPSQGAWLGYDDEHFEKMYVRREAARRGTELHNFAKEAIRLGIKMEDTKATLNQYINDALRYRMTPEVVLFYSRNAFGTADTISFRNLMLRIHDYKSGEHKANMRQLEIYAGLFCLEYGVKPFDIEIELRIYQNTVINAVNPDPDTIFHVMDRISYFDKQIELIRADV